MMSTKQTDQTIASVWNRLQCLSCEHNAQLYAAGKLRPLTPRGVRGKQIYVHDDIKENVEILGRSDEAEMKARVLWYITCQPGVFDVCSRRDWKVS